MDVFVKQWLFIQKPVILTKQALVLVNIEFGEYNVTVRYAEQGRAGQTVVESCERLKIRGPVIR
jgi:hypothetical protein